MKLKWTSQLLQSSADLILKHLQGRPAKLISSGMLPVATAAEDHYRALYSSRINEQCGDRAWDQLNERDQAYYTKKAGNGRIQFVSECCRRLMAQKVPVFASSHGYMYVESFDDVRSAIEQQLVKIYGRVYRIASIERMLNAYDKTLLTIASQQGLKRAISKGLNNNVSYAQEAVVYYLVAEELRNHLNRSYSFPKICMYIHTASEKYAVEKIQYLIDNMETVCTLDFVGEMVNQLSSWGVPIFSEKRTGSQITDDPLRLAKAEINLKSDAKTRIRQLQKTLDQAHACFPDWYVHTDQIAQSFKAYMQKNDHYINGMPSIV